MSNLWSGFSLVRDTLKLLHNKHLYSEASISIYCFALMAQLLNKICRTFITPNAMCFFKEIYMVIKYSKMEYRRDFLMPARNEIEIVIAPNELISTIKIPTLPTT